MTRKPKNVPDPRISRIEAIDANAIDRAVANLLDMTKSGLPEILNDEFKGRLALFEPPPEESATDATTPPDSKQPNGEDLSVAPQNDG